MIEVKEDEKEESIHSFIHKNYIPHDMTPHVQSIVNRMQTCYV